MSNGTFLRLTGVTANSVMIGQRGLNDGGSDSDCSKRGGSHKVEFPVELICTREV